MSTEGTEFRTADQLLAERDGKRRDLALEGERPLLQALIRPELTVGDAKDLWTAYLDLRDVILADRACADDIDGSREMNRTGATRLAIAFGLSIEERAIEEGRVQSAVDGEFDYRFRVRVRVGKGARWVDGIGSCRLSEISAKTKKGGDVPLGQREHFALTRAWTRASKRAIADILGGTEAD